MGTVEARVLQVPGLDPAGDGVPSRGGADGDGELLHGNDEESAGPCGAMNPVGGPEVVDGEEKHKHIHDKEVVVDAVMYERPGPAYSAASMRPKVASRMKRLCAARLRVRAA